MLEAEGVVLSSGAGMAQVATSRASACGSCSGKQGCGVSSLGQLLGGKNGAFSVSDPIGVAVGERVVIGLEETALLKGSMLAYLLPLALLLAGAVAGSLLAPLPPADIYAMWGALAGLLAGLGALRILGAGTRARQRYRPVIMRRVFPARQVVNFGHEE